MCVRERGRESERVRLKVSDLVLMPADGLLLGVDFHHLREEVLLNLHFCEVVVLKSRTW